MNDQDIATIIITFLLLIPWLGGPQCSQWRRGESIRKRNETKEEKTCEAGTGSAFAALQGSDGDIQRKT